MANELTQIDLTIPIVGPFFRHLIWPLSYETLTGKRKSQYNCKYKIDSGLFQIYEAMNGISEHFKGLFWG